MIKNKIGVIFEEVFQITLSGYLIFLLIDVLKEGFVSDYFNMNILLIVTLISGIGMSVFNSEKKKEEHKVFTDMDFLLCGLSSVIGGYIIYLKMRELGIISVIIAVTSAALIFLMSYMTLTEKDTP